MKRKRLKSRNSDTQTSRFNLQATRKRGGLSLYRKVIRDNFVSCTTLAGVTHRDAIVQIAEQARNPIPVDALSEELNRSLPRGRAIIGAPSAHFDQIASNYKGMEWWLSKAGLNFAVCEEEDIGTPSFNRTAGTLMAQARAFRRSSNRLPPQEYANICKALDAKGFLPTKHLERKARKALADWNQRNPRKAVLTFSDALNRPVPPLYLKRAIQKRLHRAESVWRRDLSGN